MYPIVKRTMDFLVAAVAILILLPFMLPIMLLLRLTGEGYVFYFQERVGYRNKPFMIWKFATMLKDSPNMKGGIITSKGDPRITPMGGFLRKTKLNEVPQLLNIVIGDMSLVGPRPVMQLSFDQYPEEVKNELYNVKPGITGIGSIVFRHEEDIIADAKVRGIEPWTVYTDIIYPYKGKLEAWYRTHRSVITDLKILILTFWVLFFDNESIEQRWFKDVPGKPKELRDLVPGVILPQGAE